MIPIHNRFESPRIYQQLDRVFEKNFINDINPTVKDAWFNPIFFYKNRYIPARPDLDLDYDSLLSYVEYEKFQKHTFAFRFNINHTDWQEMIINVDYALESIIEKYIKESFKLISQTFQAFVDNGICVPHWLAEIQLPKSFPIKIILIETNQGTHGYGFMIFFKILSPYNIHDLEKILNNSIVFDRKRGKVNLGLKGLYEIENDNFIHNVKLPKEDVKNKYSNI